MKKIILFRSIRPETMGFLTRDILKKFGDDSDITVITRPENAVTMKTIPYVSNVITFSGSSFDTAQGAKGEFAALKKYTFDISVIPTSGNLNSYDNVVYFSYKAFGHIPTYYYRFPSVFIEHKQNVLQEAGKALLKALATLLVIPLLITYFIGILFIRKK